jgi:phenylacetate-CoA ligase
MTPHRSEIESEELRKLNELLHAIVPANPFYTKKLNANPGNFASLRDFSERVPFTTKQEIVEDQAAHPPYGTNLTFPVQRYTRFTQTSATTGQPIRWLDTSESWDWMVELWVEVFRAAGVGRADRVFFAFSFGPFIGFWLAFDSAQRLGCLCLPGGGMSSTARLQTILDNGATVLCCTPTYALRLAEVAKQERIDLGRSRVKVLIVAGEPGGSIAATRTAIARAWNGARVFDHHGMTEIGPVTYEHPERPCALAVMESGYIAEVIDPKTDREVEAGAIGELVLTNLGRTASPLLRYRTGDLVKKSYIDNKLVLDGGILGRLDDMLIVRGTNIYPSAVEEIVRRFAQVAEYRVEVRQAGPLNELALTIEPTADCRDAAALARQLENALRAAFLLRVPVTCVPAGSLPRFEMKANRWVTVAR